MPAEYVLTGTSMKWPSSEKATMRSIRSSIWGLVKP
jgi:hypothetical protein